MMELEEYYTEAARESGKTLREFQAEAEGQIEQVLREDGFLEPYHYLAETSPVKETRMIIKPIMTRVIRIPIGRQEKDMIEQLKRQAEYLQKKIVSLEGAIKKKKQGIPEGYDGY